MQNKLVVDLDTKPGGPWPLIAQLQPPPQRRGGGYVSQYLTESRLYVYSKTCLKRTLY